MNSSCLLFTAVDQVAVSTTDVPDPQPDEVLVETLFSCVSPGTELRCLAGLQDNLGMDHFPFIPGYALIGRVLVADRQGLCPVGSVVFCSGTRRASHRLSWGGHVRHAVALASSVVPIPAGIDLVEASLAKLAAIAHRGVLLAQARPGETVVVVGLGPIGQLAARLFMRTGARVIATDLSAERVAVAAAAGLETVVSEGSVNASVRTRLPDGADVVMDATGFAPALRDTVSLVRDRPWSDGLPLGGRLIVQGSYSKDVPFPQDIAFTKELQVFWPRDCQRSDIETVLGYLAAGELKMRDVVGEPRAVAIAPDVYRSLRHQKANTLTAAFAWGA